MNPLNLKALDSKAAKRAVVANRKIGMNRNVNANSASARSRVAKAKGAGAVKNVAAANKAVSKAADDKPCVSDQRAAGGDSRRFFCARIPPRFGGPTPGTLCRIGKGSGEALASGNRNHGRRGLPATRRGGFQQWGEARFALISQNAQAIFRQRS